MDFNQCYKVDRYSENATEQFTAMTKRLSKIESGFHTKMNGRSIGGLVGSFIGTICWLAFFVSATVISSKWVDKRLLMLFLGVTLLLMIVMLIDTIVNVSYYGKISGYKNFIAQLQHRVSIGKNSIKANHDAFMESRSNGWQHPLNVATSIPQEATAVESTVAGMESLKAGFINGAKNVFYYITVIVTTAAGCLSLFPISEQIITGISDKQLSPTTLLVLNLIAAAIVLVVEIFLAKWMWGKTNCSVNNLTLFILPVGLVFFLALIALATLLVMLVTGILAIVLPIIGFLIGAAIVYFCTCGG